MTFAIFIQSNVYVNYCVLHSPLGVMCVFNVVLFIVSMHIMRAPYRLNSAASLSPTLLVFNAIFVLPLHDFSRRALARDATDSNDETVQ